MASVEEFVNLALTETETNAEKKQEKDEIAKLPLEVDTEHKLKSNSLKRFFHMPLKKKTGDYKEEGDKNEEDLANTKDTESKDQELPSSLSRSSLKSSLSNYWNAVFKPKKNKKSSKSTEIDDGPKNFDSIGDVEADNDSNFEEKVENEESEKTFIIAAKENTALSVVDDILSEKFQNLQISEEHALE